MNALTAQDDYVISCTFCQAQKQTFSRFCGETFYVNSISEVV